MNWKEVHERAKAIGGNIAPYRHIYSAIIGTVWLLVMFWSYTASWLFPLFAFTFAGGWVLWCVMASVTSFAGPRHTTPSIVSREFFIGRWEAAEATASRDTFIAVLMDDGTAERLPPCSKPGIATWEYSGRTATINWPDGWRDVLAVSAHGVVKIAYLNGQHQNSTTAVKLS